MTLLANDALYQTAGRRIIQEKGGPSQFLTAEKWVAVMPITYD